ncbi:hypothetical protein SAMN05192551_1215 [Tindallia magadiensis]|uniref:PIN like domain-containing protein n=1 Tax=Tindallia magadiensis TaxID=69895 RepID=A0A1I3I4A3_9FIRM|nr:PIN domain-containing protein [Tindallia magadiensis]SFI42623.1 hypothetical protein SAMN05192551_1215 [Tindallia magadiensis]
MKTNFREYIGYCKQEKEELWDKCVFVFDTNILLNLYRYSSETRNALLNSFETLSHSIWLPNQVALEFFKRRNEVIIETNVRYSKLELKKDKLLQEFREELRMKSNNEELAELDSYITGWIKNREHSDLLVSSHTEDIILDRLLKLYDGKVGNEYSENRLKEIYEEGKKRYDNKIPPGYKDEKKNLAKENSGYGDLILWFQIIEYSKENEKDIIFVTHDQKEDWWLKINGQTIGSRPDLVREFIDIAKSEFLMYSMDSFLNYMNENHKQSISEDVISEVKEISAVRNRVNEHFSNDIKESNLIDKFILPDSIVQEHYMLKKQIEKVEEKITKREKSLMLNRKSYELNGNPNTLITIVNTEKNLKRDKKELNGLYDKLKNFVTPDLP